MTTREPTVRERIKAIQVELREQAITPEMVREHLIQLTALYGNVMDEQREADHNFKVVLLEALNTEATANRAKIRAEVSDEYRRAREAQDTGRLVLELIRSCKRYLSSLDEEMRLAR